MYVPSSALDPAILFIHADCEDVSGVPSRATELGSVSLGPAWALAGRTSARLNPSAATTPRRTTSGRGLRACNNKASNLARES